jgi:histone-lysine N-methyltransferase SETD3
MSIESAKRDPVFSAALLLHGAGLSSEQVLAAHLLHEAARGPESFWEPYIRSLPHSYSTAMCLAEGQASELQAPHAVQMARAAAAAALEQHAGVLPLLRALQLAPKWRSRGAWLWAASTLSSRTMYLPFDSAGALTPFGDLHNYRPPPPPFAPTQEQLLAAAADLAAQVSPGRGSDAAAAAIASPCAAAGAAGEEEGSLAGDGQLDAAAGLYCITARAW